MTVETPRPDRVPADRVMAKELTFLIDSALIADAARRADRAETADGETEADTAASEAPTDPRGPSTTDLWRYARRAPGTPVDFAIERAIRQDPSARRRYGRLIEGAALGMSPMARAAATGAVMRRVVGPFELSVHDGAPGEPAVLVITVPDGVMAPTRLEVIGQEIARVELPELVAGFIQIVLGGDPEHQRLKTLITHPTTAVYLL
jgi:hypothetical protein